MCVWEGHPRAAGARGAERGKHGHSWAYTARGRIPSRRTTGPRLQALPTSFLKINTCGPGGHRGVCGRWKRPGIYAAGLCRVVADPGASAPEHTHRAPGGLCRQTLMDLPSAHSQPTWQWAGLLGRLQPLADRSKRSSRGKCHGGKFRK